MSGDDEPRRCNREYEAKRIKQKINLAIRNREGAVVLRDNHVRRALWAADRHDEILARLAHKQRAWLAVLKHRLCLKR